MTKVKHTPVPWTLEWECEDTGNLRDANGEHITHINGSRYFDDRKDEIAHENAAFIVRACNSHYDLTERGRALSEAADTLLLNLPAPEIASAHRDSAIGILLREIEAMNAAIAKAEGGTDLRHGAVTTQNTLQDGE